MYKYFFFLFSVKIKIYKFRFAEKSKKIIIFIFRRNFSKKSYLFIRPFKNKVMMKWESLIWERNDEGSSQLLKLIDLVSIHDVLLQRLSIY